jgi:hypothetical protein
MRLSIFCLALRISWDNICDDRAPIEILASRDVRVH